MEALILGGIEKNADGCWVWQGGKDGSGYGIVSARQIQRVPIRTHRLAYKLFVGDPPPGKHIHHECENRACCNPSHLRVVGPVDHAVHHHPKTGLTVKSRFTPCVECGAKSVRGIKGEPPKCRECWLVAV